MVRARPHPTWRDRNSDGRYDYACVRKPNTGTVAALLAAALIQHPFGRVRTSGPNYRCFSFAGPRPRAQDAA